MQDSTRQVGGRMFPAVDSAPAAGSSSFAAGKFLTPLCWHHQAPAAVHQAVCHFIVQQGRLRFQYCMPTIFQRRACSVGLRMLNFWQCARL